MRDIDKDIIKALADNDLNVAKTAKVIYMSVRNTWRHIDRIHEQTGFNPKKFWDMVELLKMCEVM